MLTKLSKYRRRKNLSRHRSRGGRGISRLRINWGPVLLFGGIGVGAVALILVIIFVIVPLLGGGQQAATSTPTTTETPAPTPIAKDDMSEAAEELTIDYKSINDPYVYGSQIIFSTCSKLESASYPDRLAIYDMQAATTTEVTGIEKKNNSLLEPRMNDDYIVYLDCKSEYGGSVCGVDRASGEVFVMREYLYGMPMVSLSGKYAVWMQQTGRGTNSLGTDRLYVYDLETRESVEIETFVNIYFSYSAAYIGEEAIVYVQPDREDELVTQESSSASTDAEICVMPLADGGDTQTVRFMPGMFAYNPMITGDYIVFLDGTGAPGTRLMMCEKQGDTYSAPVAIATDVLNYDVGDGYLVYTLNNTVYIYYFTDGSTGRLSSEATRALLSSANGSEVVWYDVTDGLDSSSNVIMHITVPVPSATPTAPLPAQSSESAETASAETSQAG